MSMECKRALVTAYAVGMALTLSVAAEVEYRLHEHLGRRWANQRVTFDFEAPREACHADALRLRGPAGPQAVQISAVERWPDSASVKSARLSFVVDDLAPLSENRYTVTWDAAAKATPRAVAGLTVDPTEEGVALTTTRFGARFVLGETTYDPPRAAADVPGPVARLRLAIRPGSPLADGTWFGGSRLYGEGQVTARSARLTAEGPVFARVETSYTYADGNTLTVAFELTAGDDAVWVDMEVGRDAASDGWELLLDGAPAGDRAVLLSGRSGGHARELQVNLEEVTPSLSAWSGSGWFPHGPEAIRLPLNGEASGELHLVARDRGAWVTPPAERPWWGNFNNWGRGSAGWIWMPRDRKGIPVVRDAERGIGMRISLQAGNRHWSVGHAADPTPLRETFFRRAFTTMNAPVSTLDEVKDRVLAWPDGDRPRPFIFIGRAELDAAAEQDRRSYDDLLNVNALRGALDNPSFDFIHTDPAGARNLHGYLGDFGAVHSPAFAVAARYDAIMATGGVLTPEERALLRAKLAYTAYETALPHNWSLERGYVSGNPNMSVSLVVKIGMLGIALYDHPMGLEWARYAADWVQYWLDETVNEGGVWPESSNYGRHGYSLTLKFAIAARNAGVADFFKHPQMMRMVDYYEKTLTPPDPLRLAGTAPARVVPIYGRGVRGDMSGLGGVAARAFSENNPEFAAALRWSWREGFFNEHFGWDRTAGALNVYTRSQREGPFRVPDWPSEHIPDRGYLLRSHLGQPGENYLYFISHYFRCQDSELHPWDTGAIVKWFAGGTPVGGSFINIPSSQRMALTCRVLLASNLDPEAGLWPESDYDTRAAQVASAFLPGLDYADAQFHTFRFLGRAWGPEPKDAPVFPRRERVGEAPLTWRRQLLLAADDDPDGVNYLILRDTVSGGQPTQWHFWTLSEKLGTPEEAADRAAFLADTPGAAIAPARELKGERFTAPGQFDKDFEYYVAAPSDTPRYTLRYGIKGAAGGVRGFNEFQDLLHLQREDDGVYFVAIFPRGKDEPAPRFETLGDGRVIRIAGVFGDDYCFLSETAAEAQAGDASFRGTAASVRERAEGLSLILAAAGEVAHREYGVAAEQPVTLRTGPDQARIEFPHGAPEAVALLRLPGEWAVTEERPDVTLTRGDDGWYTVKVAEGVVSVALARR